MNRLYDWVFPSRQRLYCFKWPSERFGGMSGVRNYSTASESLGQHRKKYRREIRTFRADRLHSVGQPILDLSHIARPSLRIWDAAVPRLFKGENVDIKPYYDVVNSGNFQPFPAGTTGVVYFHHVRGDNVQSQIRFRLCHSLDDFNHGEDLRGLDGNPWHITLKAMARVPNRYRPALALLQEEFPVDPRNVDPSHNSNRVISTLDPQKLQSLGQVVSDISGLTGATVHLGDSASPPLCLDYQYIGKGKDWTRRPYPSETIGIYYYKQSRTAPTRLGELRFRLCDDVQEFAQGEDLRLPSGDPWCLSSLSIYSENKYQALRNFLANEGLVADPLYPGAPSTFPTTMTMPLRVLSDPFVVDLSATRAQIDIVNDDYSTASRMILQYMFKNLKNSMQPLFSGRAIVRLEEYPSLPPDNNPDGPLVTMRFLEMLTPVKRLLDDDHVQFPEEGKLLQRKRKSGEFVPWGYNPSLNRKSYIDWIARSRV